VFDEGQCFGKIIKQSIVEIHMFGDEDREFTRVAYLQKDAGGEKIRCHVCERRCVISNHAAGWCQTRRHEDGVLITTTYGLVSALSATPIEKKPFYHFCPGTKSLSIGNWSCNFACPWCENWDITQVTPPDGGKYLSPEGFIDLVERSGCQGITLAYNEPTLSLEWALEVFQLARGLGLYSTIVTNGYMTPECLGLFMTAGLDALNVDIKGDEYAVRGYCKGIELEKIWINCGLARAHRLHLEITTLIIPKVNDDNRTLREIANRIVEELGPETPWHITAYHPAHKFTTSPPEVELLERAWKIGKAAGLDYVYLANVPGRSRENTECPNCQKILIRRLGNNMLTNAIRDSKCTQCGHMIAGVWA